MWLSGRGVVLQSKTFQVQFPGCMFGPGQGRQPIDVSRSHTCFRVQSGPVSGTLEQAPRPATGGLQSAEQQPGTRRCGRARGGAGRGPASLWAPSLRQAPPPLHLLTPTHLPAQPSKPASGSWVCCPGGSNARAQGPSSPSSSENVLSRMISVQGPPGGLQSQLLWMFVD